MDLGLLFSTWIQEWLGFGLSLGCDFDSPDGRSLGLVIPCEGRGFKGWVLSLVSVYGPVSGAGFDRERRDMFESFLVPPKEP